jgi:N-acetylglucosaminyldiphosphoundecaprenol N-acetyl-beta-D-mannosaminyltransferase
MTDARFLPDEDPPASDEHCFRAGKRKSTAFIDDLPISLASPADVLTEIARAIEAKEKGRYISITNTESMYHGLRIPAHGAFIRNSDFSLCDGVGVIIAGWAWGYNISRLNGPVLQLQCSRYGLARGWRHFYYGGKEGIADEMARRLKAEFPGLIVCGTYQPPFGELPAKEEKAVIDQINATHPDIVWVGLGLLKQERWIAEHLARIDASWMIGVGAAFDYHAGVIPWAPPLVRMLGLEWLFRLITQPRLRARRLGRSFIFALQSISRGLLSAQLFRNRT